MGSNPLRIHMSMRKDENFSLALDLKICNSLWASAIKLQDALRFTMPELLSDTHSVTSPKPESHSLLTVLPRTACARTQSYSTYSWKTRRCVFFSFLFIFFLMGAGWRERGWGIFNSWPPLSSPVKHTSFSSSKNKNCDPYPWHDGHIDVPNQSRGSWTLVFNALFCFNIVQYSRVTATNTFISQTQFCGFSPLFFT